MKDRAAREDLKDFLARNNMYLYTVNAWLPKNAIVVNKAAFDALAAGRVLIKDAIADIAGAEH